MVKLKTIFLMCLLIVLCSIAAFSYNRTLFFDFSGGLNTKVHSNLLQANECSDVSNLFFDEGLGLVRRRGYTLKSSIIGSGTIYGGTKYKLNSGISYAIVQRGNDIFKSNEMLTWSSVGNVSSVLYPCSYLTYQNFLWISNGIDLVKKYDGSTITSYSYIPKGRFMALYNESMFIANTVDEPSGIYFSDLVRGVEDSLSWYPNSLNLIYCGQNDGDIVTGLKVWNGILYVFKQKSTWKIYGYGERDENGAYDYVVSMVSERYGCIDDRTIQETQDGLIILTAEGLYLFDGSNYKKISNKTDDAFRNFISINTSIKQINQTKSADFSIGISTGIEVYEDSLRIKRSSKTWDTTADFSPAGSGSFNINIDSDEVTISQFSVSSVTITRVQPLNVVPTLGNTWYKQEGQEGYAIDGDYNTSLVWFNNNHSKRSNSYFYIYGVFGNKSGGTVPYKIKVKYDVVTRRGNYPRALEINNIISIDNNSVRTSIASLATDNKSSSYEEEYYFNDATFSPTFEYVSQLRWQFYEDLYDFGVAGIYVPFVALRIYEIQVWTKTTDYNLEYYPTAGYVSPILDTGVSSPYYYTLVYSTRNGIGNISRSVRSSDASDMTGATGWYDFYGNDNISSSLNGHRYFQFESSFTTTDVKDPAPPVLYNAALEYATTNYGTFDSGVMDVGSVYSWSNFISDYDGSVSFKIRGSSYTFDKSTDSITWNSINSLDVISLSTSCRYIQYRAIFSSYNSVVRSVAIKYYAVSNNNFSGSGIYSSAIIDNRYWLTCSTNNATNNIIYVYDSGGAFSKLDNIPTNYLFDYDDEKYFASNNDGSIFKFSDISTDSGTAMNCLWKSGHTGLGNPNSKKVLKYANLTVTPSSGAFVWLDYCVDNSTITKSLFFDCSVNKNQQKQFTTETKFCTGKNFYFTVRSSNTPSIQGFNVDSDEVPEQ
jgi:hypothetical protein